MHQIKIIAFTLMALCLFSCVQKKFATEAVLTFEQKTILISDKQTLMTLNNYFSEDSADRFVDAEAYDVESGSFIEIYFTDNSSKKFSIFLSPFECYYQNNDRKCYLMRKESIDLLLEIFKQL